MLAIFLRRNLTPNLMPAHLSECNISTALKVMFYSVVHVLIHKITKTITGCFSCKKVKTFIIALR